MRKPVPGHPAYSVDTDGVVYGKKGMPLKPFLNSAGYCMVKVYEAGSVRSMFVHHIVLKAFIGPRPDGFHGCHLNGDRIDNRLCNLTWDTPSANNSHKIAHGTHQVGTKNGIHKLTDEAVRTLRDMKQAGGIRWGAQRMAQKLGVNIATVVRAASGKSWPHVDQMQPEPQEQRNV